MNFPALQHCRASQNPGSGGFVLKWKAFQHSGSGHSFSGGGVLRLLTVLALLWTAAGQASAQTVRLREFLAVNTGGIKDGDGSFQGWIEIWNTSVTAKAVLTGMKLTDGTNTWSFPATEIPPKDNLLVWASGKNRRGTTAPLHTNFTLPAGGGTLSLLSAAATNTVISAFTDYPEQQPDVSWGRDDADTAAAPLEGRYTVPTPGEANNFAGDGVAGKVTFDTPAKAYTGTLTVTISQTVPVEGAVIRYTTDRSLPNADSTPYEGPVTVTGTQMIRARVFQPGKLPGETESAGYLFLSPEAAAFTSEIPIVVVTNFVTSAPPDDGDQASFTWVWEPSAPDNLARMTNPPVIASRSVIDKRGSSTLGNPKYNLNLETRNSFDEEERDVPLLGMPKHSDWVLHAPYSFDPALMRNPFMYALSNSIGRYAARTHMAEVFIKVTNSATGLRAPASSGDYYGVYNVMEKIRRNADRVAIDKLDMYQNGEVEKTGGYMWKVDRLDPGDGGLSAGGTTLAYYYPKEVDMETPQRDPQEQYLKSYINTFASAINKTTAGWNDPITGYARYLDIPSAIDHHLLNVWANNVDGLRLSTYWYKERGGKIHAGPVWDFDRTLSSTDGRDDNPAIWAQAGDSTDHFQPNKFHGVPWWHRMFLDSEFYQQYIDRWQELRRGAFAPEKVNGLLDSLNAEIGAAAAARDFTRWKQAKRTWKSPFTNENFTGQAAEVQRLKDFLQQRANFMDTEWVAPVSASVPAGSITPGTAVTLTGPATAVIYYTLDGTDPRPAGGAAPTEANVFTYTAGTPLVINASTRLRARAYDAAFTRPTNRAQKPPLISKWGGINSLYYSTDIPAAKGNLVITEVNYHPADPTAAELTVNPAWTDKSFEFIELHNRSAAAIDLTGAALTAGVNFSFAPETPRTLAAGGYLVIAANPAAFASRYGDAVTPLGPFTGDLSNGGETITLTDAAGVEILTFTYDDAWTPEADGDGNTMVIRDPAVAVEAFNLGESWRASSQLNGSPGTADGAGALTLTAGPDITAPLTGAVLAGSLAGAPPESAAIVWSQESGPGSTTVTPADSLTGTAVFSTPGVYVLKASATAGGQTLTDEVTVYAVDTPAAWLERHPGAGTLTDDPDGDGRNNLMEFATGTNPLLADQPAQSLMSVENGKLTLSFHRIHQSAGVGYVIEVSDDLTTFRPAAAGEFTEEIVTDSGITQVVKLTDTVAATAPGKRFVRLKVTASP